MPWILWSGLNANISFYKKKTEGSLTQIHGGEDDIKMEAKTGVMRPQAKETENAESHKNLEEAKKKLSLKPLEKSPRVLSFWPLKLENNHKSEAICYRKPRKLTQVPLLNSST